MDFPIPYEYRRNTDMDFPTKIAEKHGFSDIKSLNQVFFSDKINYFRCIFTNFAQI